MDRLLSISSAPLSGATVAISPELETLAGSLSKGLLGMLARRNGFYAFESALHVLPSESVGGELSIADWNDRRLWIAEYDGLADGFLFFAEDVFGGQFAMKAGRIWAFDPETGVANDLAGSLEEWAKVVMEDHESLTGHPLGHRYQSMHGSLDKGTRLVPRIPFVLGGEFDIDNLRVQDAVCAMCFRASIARQIRDLPDGAPVQLAFGPDPGEASGPDPG